MEARSTRFHTKTSRTFGNSSDGRLLVEGRVKRKDNLKGIKKGGWEIAKAVNIKIFTN